MSESKLLIENKTIVVPGEKLATGMDFLPSFGTYRKDQDILANMLGLANIDGKVIKLVPLSGVYFPKRNDTVIGRVSDVTMNGWRVNINCAYESFLSTTNITKFVRRGEDLTNIIEIGDYLVAKVFQVTSQNLVDLTMKGPGLQKLGTGRIIDVNSQKVPRIIGKQGSMVTMIKNATGTKINVGQNGLIWVNGSPEGEIVAVKAIRMIEQNSHVSGLTDRVKEFLEKNKVAGVEPVKEQAAPQEIKEGE